MTQSMLSASDFNRILDDYAGRTIPHTPITKTQNNITGEEVLVESDTVQIKCYVMKTGQNFDYDKYGLLEKGDMVGLFKYSDSVTVNDIVTVNGEKFRVKEAYDVPGVFDSSSTATYVYTVGSLFLIDDQ